MASKLKQQLPWIKTPFIISAPMGGFAGPDLAIAVTKSGGLGQIGAVFDMQLLDRQLTQVSDAFRSEPQFSQQTLPIGVGLLPFILKIDSTVPVLAKHNPAVIWLFAAKELEDYTTWTKTIRETCPHSQVWIQIGSVTGALQLAQSCSPDAIVLQGIDAGGHGFEKGAGIISLLPEVTDAFMRSGFGHIPLVASGGIVDGRGSAAALSLGAQAVVLGTRFLAAKETMVHPKYRQAVIETSDGGQNTVRSKLFDELTGPNIWPHPYDGRSLRTNSYLDHIDGVSLDEIRERHKQALKETDLGWGDTNRANIWAGTGVGLVNSIQGAAEIVEEVRNGTIVALDAARARL